MAVLKEDDSSKTVLEKAAGLRFLSAVAEHVSGANCVDAAKADAILNIAQYVKSHPRATEAELVKLVTEQIRVFRERITAPQSLI